MNIHQYPEKDFWEKAGEYLSSLLQQHAKEKVLLLLSGGSVVRLYSSIKYQVSGIKYKNITIAQVDERFQPKSELRSKKQELRIDKNNINSFQIEKTGLWQWCGENKIPYHLVSQEGTLGKAAMEYDRVMEKLFKECDYKIAILGIGEDGHTAGLLPHYRQLWDIKKYVVGYEIIRSKIKNQRSKINESSLSIMQNSEEFRKRISITPFALKQLDQAIVIALGKRKKNIINKLKEEVRTRLHELSASSVKHSFSGWCRKHCGQGYSTRRVELMELNELPVRILYEIPEVEIFTPLFF